MSSQGWRLGIICSRAQINLDTLLTCGQSFRWKRKNGGEWLGVIQNHVWRLRQTGSGILYIVYGDKPIGKKQLGSAKTEMSMKKDMKYTCGNSDSVVPKSVKLKLEESSSNLHVQNLNPLSVGNNGPSRKTKVESRKRSAMKVVDADDVTPKKLVKSEIDAECVMSLNKGRCLLPSELLKNGVIKTESLKEMYIKEDLRFSDENELLHNSEDCENVLRDYFQADIDLSDLYDHWSSRDSHFQDVAAKFGGIRMLRQDPTENLLSFVCSSNNHISRISSMVEKLCVHYGTLITEVDEEEYYSFPALAALTGNQVEGHLRQLGFGYRAKFISAIAKYVTQEKEEGWLETLRDDCSYKEAKSELMKLMGVGAKVADCVCLMSLDKPEAVPVDTHVWQITLKNYLAKLQHAKSLTEKIYNEIGDFYRDLWGPYAGWAHSVLFTADLNHNKTKEVSNNQKKNGKGCQTKDEKQAGDRKAKKTQARNKQKK